MLMYGICANDVQKNANWKAVIKLLQEFDQERYQEFLEDVGESYTDSDVEDWFDQYEVDGRSGLGAFLYDVIKHTEKLDIDIDDPDGVYIGISAGAPWEFPESIKGMKKDDFDALLNKYVVRVTGESMVVQWHKVDDDLDW